MSLKYDILKSSFLMQYQIEINGEEIREKIKRNIINHNLKFLLIYYLFENLYF